MGMKFSSGFLAVALTVGGVEECLAWGAAGHEWVSGLAIESLPESVPMFVRTPEAAVEIAVLGRELDRSKGAGKTHDAERDPGHYIDLADNSDVMGEDSGEAARLFRDDGARDSEMMPPGSAATLADAFVALGSCRRQSSNLF